MSDDGNLDDAIAVIGMSCRFSPDLDTPEKLWDFLADRRNHVTDMPARRWDPYASSSPQATAVMRTTTRKGSFLDDIEGFDADFFGITPREADFLDPQQRITLELAWEALGNAGLPPSALRGTEAGVWVAANSNDYGRRLLEDIPRTGAYAVNGTTYYGIANRVSYFLDLRGPSVAVDTACAGSLTALHLACQSLRLGETPLAIVGGINIMATPALFVALDAAGATSPDGRSKAFDKAADGYGRGEGAGVTVLKRLADARRDGDPVLAVILASGVFQDGRSDGMMAPNSEAQEHMLREVYRRAKVAPDTVGYVEAHGTGTPVGDREEATALARVFGVDRPADDPCLVGSIKPNIGHTEAGSGIAGVIKTVLALQNSEIPPSLHDEPSPSIDWKSAGLKLVDQQVPWQRNGSPRRAGVSSYGVGGTIAHLVLQEAPAADAAPSTPAAEAAPTVYPVSAMADPGLKALAGQVADWLDANPQASAASIGHTLGLRRAHLPQRAAVVASSPAELAAQLRRVAAGDRGPGLASRRAIAGEQSGAVWVFSGHGAQWAGMGRGLLRDEPVFAAGIDALGEVFAAELGATPREMLAQDTPWSTAQVQALTFAVQVALADVWRNYGLEPAAVIGHSVGEIAAAVIAGVLDRQAAARFACRRAAALQELEGRGAMALVSLTYDEVARHLDGRTDVVAAISASPGSTVVSGDVEAVRALAAQWRAEELTVFDVDTTVAFHSPQVSDILARVRAGAAELRPQPATIALYTTALTDPRSAAPRDQEYWATNLREPVRFAEAVAAAAEDGYRCFLEVSTHPVVTYSIREALDHAGVEDYATVGTLRRDQDERTTLLTGLAELHCSGVPVDWPRMYAGGELLGLPVMAWQHRPYWIFPDANSGSGLGGGHNPESHTLLGGRLSVSGAPARQVWQTYLDLNCRPYPQSHEVVGVEITPAAVLIDTFVTAATKAGTVPALSDVVLRTPVSVVPPRVVQVVLAENSIRMASRLADDGGDHDEREWITHCTANIEPIREEITGRLDIDAVRTRCYEESGWQKVDNMFRTMGVGGYAFPWDVEELRHNREEQLAVITIEPGADRARSWAHVIDGALTISAVVVTPEDARRLWMSCHIGSVAFQGEPPASISVHSRRSPRSPQDTVDVEVADQNGDIVLVVQGLRFSAIQDEFGAVAAPRDLVHEIAWRPLEPASVTERPVRRAVLVGAGTPAQLLGRHLAEAGVETEQVSSADDLMPSMLERAEVVLVVPPAETAEDTDVAAEDAAWSLIRSAQRLSQVHQASTGKGTRPRLWCVTHGVRTATREESLKHAPLWGVSRIVAGEHPELWGGTVDVESVDADTTGRLLTLLRTAAGAEDVISLGEDGPETPRLTQIERASDAPMLQCHPSGTYLITGGLGALGRAVGQWLIERGARRLLLAGRRGLPPRAQWGEVRDARTRRVIEDVTALEALGATVRVVALDITDAEQVATALHPSTHGLPPVRGIIHAAGVVRDAMVDKVDRAGLHDVLGPKATGALVLHRLFPPGSLDFMVFFSSCGQFARLTGQTSYAAANSFLDTLAAHRQADGRTDTVSMGWTAWRGVGMSEAIAGTIAEANARGLEAISPAEAFRAWSFADRFRTPYHAVLRVLPVPAGAPRVPMFRDLAAIDAQSGDGGGAGAEVDWAGLTVEELREIATTGVREQVAAELNLTPEGIDNKRPLVELGVDSVMTVALRVRLQRHYGIDLPPTILWAAPTVAALATYIIELKRPAEPADDDALPLAA